MFFFCTFTFAAALIFSCYILTCLFLTFLSVCIGVQLRGQLILGTSPAHVTEFRHMDDTVLEKFVSF